MNATCSECQRHLAGHERGQCHQCDAWLCLDCLVAGAFGCELCPSCDRRIKAESEEADLPGLPGVPPPAWAVSQNPELD
jgi:hypothetical protein